MPARAAANYPGLLLNSPGSRAALGGQLRWCSLTAITSTDFPASQRRALTSWVLQGLRLWAAGGAAEDAKPSFFLLRTAAAGGSANSTPLGELQPGQVDQASHPWTLKTPSKSSVTYVNAAGKPGRDALSDPVAAYTSPETISLQLQPVSVSSCCCARFAGMHAGRLANYSPPRPLRRGCWLSSATPVPTR